MDVQDQAAEVRDQICIELDAAAAHARTVAARSRIGEIPRAPAHGFAVVGHLAAAERLLTEAAELHGRCSAP